MNTSSKHWPKLVAFTGLSGAGKDCAAEVLIEHGYKRHNFGDIIKRQIEPLIRTHFGFSAFTEAREEKAKIRRTLESWGEDNYDAILKEFLNELPERAVNTRLCRSREAEAWRQRSGVIIEIVRPGLEPATLRELEWLNDLVDVGLTEGWVTNDGSKELLRSAVVSFLGDFAAIDGVWP